MESADNNRGTPTKENISRRFKKLKNLEQEVEMILSQDESDEDLQPAVHGDDMPLPKTPSTNRKVGAAFTPRASEPVLQDMVQTPRRSCRKSIKPPQDYEDIVRKSARSVSRSTRKNLISLSEAKENEESVEEHHKWNTANVGRTSSKRSRKSKRSTKGKRGLNEGEHDEDAKAANVEEAQIVTANSNNLDVDTVKNEMENYHFALEKCEEIETTVQAEKNQVEMESNISGIPSENINSTKQDNVVVDDEQEEDEIHLIQEDSEDFKDFAINSNKNENSLEQVEEEKMATVDQEEEEIHSIQDDEDSKDFKDFPISSDNVEVSIKEVEEENKETTDIVQPEEEIHLIQEYSEDFKDITTNSGKETTVTVAIPHTEQDDENEDSFGCYLKSKKINIEDLGLNPIIDDDDDVAEEDKKENIKSVPTVVQEVQEEMPSLIVCDDDEENEGDKGQGEAQKQKLNETFDADDSVVVVLDTANINSTTSEAVEMDALQLSEDESENSQESARKVPRIMLTNTEELNETLLSTPKQSNKPYRFPTPYRNRSETKLKNENIGSAKKLPLAKENLTMTSSFTTMTPRDIVLRGIRKRSMSVCLGAEELSSNNCAIRSAKRNRHHRGPNVQKIVNFYSPANQTAIIEDFDKLVAKSVKKNNTNPELNRNKNVTTRRRRSMSFDESMMSKSLSTISKLPRPVTYQKSFLNATTTVSSSLSSSSSKTIRTKLPNFAAIHQKQFQNMENLVDHVTRKQERSKVLITSATKIRPASVQKNISVNVNSRNTQLEKPKALKRIDMTSQSQTTKIKPTNSTVAPRKIVSAQNKTTDANSTTTMSELLPNPRNMKVVNKPKQQLLPKKHLKPTQTLNVSSMPKTMANSTFVQKPAFNLSTNTGSSTTKKKSTSATKSLSSTSTTTTTRTRTRTTTKTSAIENKPLTTQDKMASRLQRHMDLFKGRVPAARAGVASRKNEAGVIGVRSNRRFELQMQHRRNIEN